MEINLICAVFHLTKDFCINHTADFLGFRSTKAKQFISGAANHRLSWQVMNIVFTAFAMELLSVYVWDCKRMSIEPSNRHLHEWKQNIVNSNFNFIYNLVFKCYLPVKCFRNGIRRNNSEYMLAGCQGVPPLLFFIGNHYIYRKIILNDMSIRVQAPSEIKDYISRNESLTRSGNPNRGEGGDY